MTTFVSTMEGGGEGARAALARTVTGGGVAVFPADGLYGLACDPLNPDAIERLHGLKGRDDGKPSAVLFFSPLIMRELISSLGERTGDAISALLPGPVTAVVHNPEHRYPLACREDPERLGIRLIDGPLTGLGTPLFQTSANRSGEQPPSRVGDIDSLVARGADLVVDGGDLTGAPSTVVDLTGLETGGDWTVLRQGGLDGAELERRLRGI